MNSRKLLIVVLGLAILILTGTSHEFSFAPRDEKAEAIQAQVSAEKQMAEMQASLPSLSMNPERFPELTYTELTKELRTEGFQVRCYANLQRKEKLHPSITQICWTRARKAWDVPLDGISFHFAGEKLQLVRIEFPNAQWAEAKHWFDTLPGKMAGTFGTDGKGNTVLGKSVAAGLLMTAKPPGKDTVMALWESRDVLNDLCTGRDRSFSEEQRKVLCTPPP